MAATQTRPAAAEATDARARASLGHPAPIALGLALLAALTYAAFASGAAGIQEESKLQVFVAAVSLVAVAAAAFGHGLRFRPRAPAGAGLLALAAFTVWCGLSLIWSIAPDETWVETNRALAYTLVAALALALGSSLPRAVERVALGYLALASLVALYALGGKALPGFHIGGLIDLNHAEAFSRLRAPLDYWNALALFCVMAVPVALALAASPLRSLRLRLAATVALVPLSVTVLLSYSRGGLVVLVVALIVLVLSSGDRLRLLAFIGAGLVGSIPPAVAGLLLNDLNTNGLPVGERSDGGLIFLASLLLGLAIALLLGLLVTRADEKLGGRRGPAIGRKTALVACFLALGLLVFGAARSEGGLAGAVKRQASDLTARKYDPQDDPSRLLRTNSGNRWNWWGEALGAASDAPIVGHGAGSFPLLHLQYREDPLNVQQPHSVPLEFLSETGIVGAALGLGGLALLLVAASRGALARREDAMGIALLAALAAWSLHLFVDWDWDMPAVTLPALIFLGVLAARPVEDRHVTTLRRGRPSLSPGSAAYGLGLAAAALVLCLAIASALLPAKADSLTRDAREASSSDKLPELRAAAADAHRASQLNPFAVDALQVEAGIAANTGEGARSGRLLLDAIERQPENPDPRIQLATLRLAADDPRGAFRALVEAARLDPLQSYLYIAAGQTALDPGYSASSVGTPLPERLPSQPAPKPAPSPQPDQQQDQATTTPDTATPQPTQPTPTPAPVTPAPAPAPTPTPTPQPPAQQFDSQG